MRPERNTFQLKPENRNVCTISANRSTVTDNTVAECVFNDVESQGLATRREMPNGILVGQASNLTTALTPRSVIANGSPTSSSNMFCSLVC